MNDDCEANFEAFLKKPECLVMFHKKHCPNCKVMETVLAKLQKQIPSLKVLKIDSERNVALLERLEGARVPSLFVFKNGQKVGMKVGVCSPMELEQFYYNSLSN